MSDEAMSIILATKDLQYTIPFYVKYITAIWDLVDKLNIERNGKWHSRNLESALWAFSILNEKPTTGTASKRLKS